MDAMTSHPGPGWTASTVFPADLLHLQPLLSLFSASAIVVVLMEHVNLSPTAAKEGASSSRRQPTHPRPLR